MQRVHTKIVALLKTVQILNYNKKWWIWTRQSVLVTIMIMMMATVKDKRKEMKRMTHCNHHLLRRRYFCSRRLCQQYHPHPIKPTTQQMPQLIKKISRHCPHYSLAVCHSTRYFSVLLSITPSHLLEVYTLFISCYEHHMFVQ